MKPINSSLSNPPASRVTLVPSSRAWSEVTQTGEDSYRIRLEGPFGPSWIANLCAELADRQLSIDRAHAMRTSNQTWVAELNVVALEGAADPLSIAYVELAEAGAPDASDPLQLVSFDIEETTAHGGSLQLTVEAVDGLGLLGSLLSQLAMLFLFPVEMHIETRDGRAHDIFWLGTVGATNPGPRVRDSLIRVLSRAKV
jgi:UTP:GlnB (protein PII) uridylyltransferase